MKNLVLLIMLAAGLYACSLNDPMIYDEKPSVYFADFSDNADSLVYSFTTTAYDTATINLRVKLLGALIEDRMYSVVINPESTAEEGKHFDALNDTYTYTAGQTTVNLPIHLNYSPDLDDNTVVLSISLVANDQMDLGYPDKITARILITNQLIKPVYWDYPFSLYFGVYSKVKHQICTDIMGHDFPLTLAEARFWNNSYTAYGYWMHAGRLAAVYFAKNKVYDENGNLINTWSPF